MATSLRAQLLRRLLVPMLLVTATGGVISYFLGLNYANDAYDQSLLDNARSLAREVEFTRGGVRLDLSPQAMDMLQWDPIDKVYYRIDSDQKGLLSGSRELVPADVIDEDRVYQDGQIHGQPVRTVTVGVIGDGQLIRVSVAETLNKRSRLIDELLIAVLLPQLLLVALVVGVIWLGIKRGLAPIAELEQAAHLRTPANLTPLPDREVPDELQPFTQAINALLSRLGKTMEAQNRFIADAAHQLRTPLAALGVQLESALRESRPEGQGDLLRQALASLDRTTRLSNQLLLLARAESDAGLAVRHARLDLRQIAFEAGASWVPKALQQGADLGLEGPDGEVPLLGDALLLAEVVNNLIDNALRYAGEKPRITLCVQANLPGQGPMLWVEDNGPGIPPEERDAVFERFHRVAGSPSAGSGLGLAIVKEIARAHGAEVFVDQASTGGMRVGLKFPALEM